MDKSKIKAAVDKILTSPEAASVMMERILSSEGAVEALIERMRVKNDLHVMRGLSHMRVSHPERIEGARKAAVLDIETTGLDHNEHKVIQLSMLKVLYDDAGIVQITDDIFDQLQDPGSPLDIKISRLTGFRDQDLAGKAIDQDSASAFLDDCDMVIAHNAAFDRKFVEKHLPAVGFAEMDWACSIRDVNWDERIAGSPKLELLALQKGYVYPAHNARADITATAQVLSMSYGFGDEETSAFMDVLDARKRSKVMVMAVGLGFGHQDPLKAAGWKWSPDRSGDAGDKCWHVTVSTPDEAITAAKAAKEAFGGDVSLPVRRFTMRNVYSDRLPPVERNGFSTKDPLRAINAHDIVAEPEVPGQTSFGF